MGPSVSFIQRLSKFYFLSAEDKNITKVENLMIAEMSKISRYFISQVKNSSSN